VKTSIESGNKKHVELNKGCDAEKKGEQRTAQMRMTKRPWLVCAFLVAQDTWRIIKITPDAAIVSTSGAK
jgi:hypothetical protein